MIFDQSERAGSYIFYNVYYNHDQKIKCVFYNEVQFFTNQTTEAKYLNTKHLILNYSHTKRMMFTKVTFTLLLSLLAVVI